MKNIGRSRKTKMRVYRVAIRPLVTYAAEAMILTKGEEEKLRRFERKIVRKTCGSKKVVKGIYQKLKNSGVQEGLRGENILKAIKILRWYLQIRRMGEEKAVKKVTAWKPNFNKVRGRPKRRIKF